MPLPFEFAAAPTTGEAIDVAIEVATVLELSRVDPSRVRVPAELVATLLRKIALEPVAPPLEARVVL